MLKLQTTEERIIAGQKRKVRIYKHSITNTEVTTYLLKVDKFSNEWYCFEDLFSIPFIRQMAAKKVVDLYGHGLSLEDIKGYTTQIKTLLKTNGDPDKYEKIFAKVLEMETLTETMADPVRQCLGLCTVYLLINDELPEVWNNQNVSIKMSAMIQDVELQSFFLNWWTGIMKNSGQVLKGLSQIASMANQLSGNGMKEL